MTEKELRKLNRYQLLELLIMQTERANDLEQQLAEAQKKLDEREVNMTVVGSIAEASVQLGGLLEAAQKTADIYLDGVRQRAAMMEAKAAEEARLTVEQARQEAQRIMQEAERKSKHE